MNMFASKSFRSASTSAKSGCTTARSVSQSGSASAKVVSGTVKSGSESLSSASQSAGSVSKGIGSVSKASAVAFTAIGGIFYSLSNMCLQIIGCEPKKAEHVEKGMVYILGRPVGGYRQATHHFIGITGIDGKPGKWRIYEWAVDGSNFFWADEPIEDAQICLRLGRHNVKCVSRSVAAASHEQEYDLLCYNCNTWTQSIARELGHSVSVVHVKCKCISKIDNYVRDEWLEKFKFPYRNDKPCTCLNEETSVNGISTKFVYFSLSFCCFVCFCFLLKLLYSLF